MERRIRSFPEEKNIDEKKRFKNPSAEKRKSVLYWERDQA